MRRQNVYEELIKGDELEELDFDPNRDVRKNQLRLEHEISQDVYAIDTSSMILGETSEGILFCIRGVVIHWDQEREYVKITDKFESPCFVSENNRQTIYRALRKDLWGLETGEESAPENLKMVDRVRNIYERYLQKTTAEKAKDSLLLFDGSLTGGTVDTPKQILQDIISASDQNHNSILAFSKKTKLKTLQGQKIADLLLGSATYPVFLPVTRLLKKSMAQDILGEVFIARLCRLPIFFRVDIHAKRAEEAASNLLRSVFLEHGYPKPLIQAHLHCYFNGHDAFTHRVVLGKRGVFVREEFDIRRLLFGIYG